MNKTEATVVKEKSPIRTGELGDGFREHGAGNYNSESTIGDQRKWKIELQTTIRKRKSDKEKKGRVK